MSATNEAKTPPRPTTVKLPVFVRQTKSSFDTALGLPPLTTNLFQRLIRSPRIESQYAKERECTEMLCALLLNAPMLRWCLFGWMADQIGLPTETLDALTFEIETEQPIGNKRDDLRIVGRSIDTTDLHPALIWTVEVKVGAWFHASGQQYDDAAAEMPVDDDCLPVNQLLNYDHWLSKQSAEHRAGFVLAITEHTGDLPESLICSWACLTWTGLGEQIAAALRVGELSASEQLPARHALGFIRANLWRTSEMADTRLDYNDISLIRAYAAIAEECEEKVDRLVGSLAEVLENSGIGKGKISETSSLFSSGCTTVYRELNRDCFIIAGIGADLTTGEDYIAVWIETPPKHPNKAAIQTIISIASPKMRDRNPRWRHMLPTDERSVGGVVDMELTQPLASLLVADDQVAAAQAFIRTALDDLKVAGLADSFAKLSDTTAKEKKK